MRPISRGVLSSFGCAQQRALKGRIAVAPPVLLRSIHSTSCSSNSNSNKQLVISNICKDNSRSSILGLNITPSRKFSSSASSASVATKEEDEEEEEDEESSTSDSNSNDNNDNISSNKAKTLDALGRSYATGRRKTSVARVWLSEGSGQFTVNHRSFVEYFQGPSRDHILEPFIATATAGKYDVYSTVKGGGFTGQAGALRLGISKALEVFTPSLRSIMRREGMLTRDSRRVERKKPGQKKARKKFQWVKR